MNITDKYDSFIHCEDNKNKDIDIIIKNLLLSIRGSLFLVHLFGLVVR